jgi:hypothetical protein
VALIQLDTRRRGKASANVEKQVSQEAQDSLGAPACLHERCSPNRAASLYLMAVLLQPARTPFDSCLPSTATRQTGFTVATEFAPQLAYRAAAQPERQRCQLNCKIGRLSQLA